MASVDYLDGSVYHMSHFDNLRSILKTGALLSQQELDSKGIKSRSIANQEVQSLRRRIHVWDLGEKRYRPLHSYVPFYFARQTPMLRNQHNKGNKGKLVVFEVNRAFLEDESVLFTDGNASNQQLSKSAGEEVRIVPATISGGPCRREYLPNGQPYGTNQKCSDFYNDTVFLERVNWDVIYRHHEVEFEEYKRVVHAEALFPDRFPLDEMLNICVNTKGMVEAVKNVFSECGLTEADFDLPIVCRPNLFL